MKSLHFVGALLTGLALLAGCNLDEIDTDRELPSWTPSFGVPVGSTTYTVQELLDELEDSTLHWEEDNSMLLKVIYTDSSGFDDIDEIVVIDDVSNPGSIAPGFDIQNPPADTMVAHTENLQFEYPISQGEQLDSIIYLDGTVRLDMQSTFSVDFQFDFIIHDIVNSQTGDTLIFSETIPAGGTLSENLSLSGYRTIAESEGALNVFTGVFDGVILVTAGNSVNPADSLSYTLSIENVTYQTVYGYFGEKNYEVQDRIIEIGFFEDIDVDLFAFKSPEINLTIENAFGVKMGLDLSDITSIGDGGQTTRLSGEITESLQFVQAPTVNNVGGSVTSLVSINSNNSNLRDLFANAPTQFNIALSAQSNFNAVDSVDRNFVDIASTASVLMEMELPLDVSLQNFTRDFDFGIDSLNLDEADTVVLIVKSVNLLPLTGIVDLQLHDATGNILYEVPDLLLIESPDLPLSGRPDTPQETIAMVPFYGESLEALENATLLILAMNVNSFDSENGTFVKIFSDSELELIVSMEVGINKEL